MQHHHVQRVALDPFAAINQPPQRAQRAADGNAECVLDRMHRAHLIGDGANAADARDDVRRFGMAAPAQQRLEQARRLENVQLRRSDLPIDDLKIEGAFAFDAREQVDPDGLSRHGRRSRAETAVRRR